LQKQAYASELLQDKITGVVMDASNSEPLPGVNVLWQGTNQGTITDIEGKFAIESNSSTTMLQISYVGYLTEVIDVAGKSSIEVMLVTDIQSLDEIVVVGYSSQKKLSLTTAVSTVKGDELLKKSTPDIRKALQGSVPGLSIIDQGGAPGRENINLRIRGITSMNDTDPLVLVDGVEQSINNVDANAIESITVLKDAASTAIYGSRGANGVILITTKRGSEGTINFTYNMFYGVSNATIRPESIGTRDYMELQNLTYENAGQSTVPYEDIDGYMEKMAKYPDLYPKAFPEWNEFFQWAPLTKHSIVATGGSEHVQSMVNLAYENQKSTIPGSGSKTFQFRANNDIKITDYLSSFLNLSLQRKDMFQPNGIDPWYYQFIFNMSEFQNKAYPDGTYGFSEKGTNIWHMTDHEYMGKHETLLDNAVLNLGTELNILNGLKYEFAYMVNASWESNMFNLPRYVIHDYWNENVIAATNAINQYKENRREGYRTTLNSILSYNKRLGSIHDISILAGYTEDEYIRTGISAGGQDFYNNELRNLEQGDPELRSLNNIYNDWGLRSFFGRVGYSFRDKYFFEAISRYDGSSRFPEGKKYTLFPSTSLAWRISEEQFWSNLKPVINELKVRYSYGVTGSQNIGNYTHIPQLIISNNYAFYTGSEEELVTSVGLEDLASTELSWETTIQHNIGLDMAFLDNKLSFSLELFDKVTDGILLDVPIPAVVGLNPSKTNAGVISNKGFESSFLWRDNFGEFNYNLSVNASYVADVIEDFGGLPMQTMHKGRYYRKVGTPLFALYGYKVDGFYKDQDDIDNSPARGSRDALFPGDLKYKDISGPDGVPDGEITDEYDRVDLGYGTPRYFYGMNFNCNWKGVDFSMFWQGAGGHMIPLYGKIIEGGGYGGWTTAYANEDYWTGPEDVDARFPVPRRRPGNNIQESDFWLVKGDYFRLKSLTVGYTFDNQKWMGNINIASVRLYANAMNPLTISEMYNKWQQDPEGNLGALRYDYFPQTKSYNMGVSVNF